MFRVAGSLPASVVEQLRFEREQEEKQIARTENERERPHLLREYRWEHFELFEKLLHGNSRGSMWLRMPEIAEIVNEAIHHRDRKDYDLIAYTIMPNHVHMVFDLVHTADRGRDSVPSYKEIVCRVADPTMNAAFRVTNVIGSLKKYTALRANRVLGRAGAFWHNESYDHVIRDVAELDRTIEYVLMNPVKAGLCKEWREWKWSYVKEGYIGD